MPSTVTVPLTAETHVVHIQSDDYYDNHGGWREEDWGQLECDGHVLNTKIYI